MDWNSVDSDTALYIHRERLIAEHPSLASLLSSPQSNFYLLCSMFSISLLVLSSHIGVYLLLPTLLLTLLFFLLLLCRCKCLRPGLSRHCAALLAAGADLFHMSKQSFEWKSDVGRCADLDNNNDEVCGSGSSTHGGGAMREKNPEPSLLGGCSALMLAVVGGDRYMVALRRGQGG